LKTGFARRPQTHFGFGDVLFELRQHARRMRDKDTNAFNCNFDNIPGFQKK
jgi:hypothetical protein